MEFGANSDNWATLWCPDLRFRLLSGDGKAIDSLYTCESAAQNYLRQWSAKTPGFCHCPATNRAAGHGI